MIGDFAALTAAHMREQERALRVKAERRTAGCLPECRLIQRVYAGWGVSYQHWMPDGEPAELRLEDYQPHWNATTLLPTEALNWLRSLHPVSDTTCSVDEPEVYKLMRGEM